MLAWLQWPHNAFFPQILFDCQKTRVPWWLVSARKEQVNNLLTLNFILTCKWLIRHITQEIYALKKTKKKQGLVFKSVRLHVIFFKNFLCGNNFQLIESCIKEYLCTFYSVSPIINIVPHLFYHLFPSSLSPHSTHTHIKLYIKIFS